MCRAHFPAFKPRASCSFVAFFTFLLVMESGVAAPAPVAKSKPKAEQTIELGNVGEKATVNIKQVQGVAPEDHKLVIGLLAKRDADARLSEQRVAELEAELRKTREAAVSRVLDQTGEKKTDDLALRARQALLNGETALAEQLLRRQEETAAAAAQDNRREAAQRAREIASLAIGRDSHAALEALARAASYLPDDFGIRVELGDAQSVMGQSAAALATYRAAFAIAESQAARDPANTEWQRDLSISHSRIGEVLLAQGDGAGALAAFRKGLAIDETLAARDPANTQWQRDLSVSHNKIGDVLDDQGDGPGALAVYWKCLAIRETLAGRDPANTEWQRDLSASYQRIGDVLVAQGDVPGALVAYRKGLAIGETLTGRDPANTEWQRDVSVSHTRIGNVLVAQGDGPGALAAYRKGLSIRDTLVGRDPANTGWQRDLSVSHNKIGDMLVAQGDGPGALAAYRKSLAIRETLAGRDPGNTQWQKDVAVSCSNLGKSTELPVAERRAMLARGLKILRDLRQAGRLPLNRDWWPEAFEVELKKLNDAGMD